MDHFGGIHLVATIHASFAFAVAVYEFVQEESGDGNGAKSRQANGFICDGDNK